MRHGQYGWVWTPSEAGRSERARCSGFSWLRRDNKTQSELFVAGVACWERALHHLIQRVAE